MSGQDPERMPPPHPTVTAPAPQPSYREAPCLKVHHMQLAVSPCQDKRILLQRKTGWGQIRTGTGKDHSLGQEQGRVET